MCNRRWVGQPALGVISDVGIPSLFIEKASLPTQRSGRCSSVVELGTCHLRPRFNSWLRADFCVFLITIAALPCGTTGCVLKLKFRSSWIAVHIYSSKSSSEPRSTPRNASSAIRSTADHHTAEPDARNSDHSPAPHQGRSQDLVSGGGGRAPPPPRPPLATPLLHTTLRQVLPL